MVTLGDSADKQEQVRRSEQFVLSPKIHTTSTSKDFHFQIAPVWSLRLNGHQQLGCTRNTAGAHLIWFPRWIKVRQVGTIRRFTSKTNCQSKLKWLCRCNRCEHIHLPDVQKKNSNFHKITAKGSRRGFAWSALYRICIKASLRCFAQRKKIHCIN